MVKRQKGGACYQLGIYDNLWSLRDLKNMTIPELQTMNYNNWSLVKGSAKLPVPPVIDLKSPRGSTIYFIPKDFVVIVKCDVETKSLPFAFNLVEVMRQILVSSCNMKRKNGVDIIVNPISQRPYSPYILEFFNNTFKALYAKKLTIDTESLSTDSVAELVGRIGGQKGKEILDTMNPAAKGLTSLERTSRAAGAVGLGITIVSLFFAAQWLLWIGVAVQFAQTHSKSIEMFLKSEKTDEDIRLYAYSILMDISTSSIDWMAGMKEAKLKAALGYAGGANDLNQVIGYLEKMAGIAKSNKFDAKFAKTLIADEKRRQNALPLDVMKNPKNDMDSFQKACTLGRLRKSVHAIMGAQRMQRMMQKTQADKTMTKFSGKTPSQQIGSGRRKLNKSKVKKGSKISKVTYKRKCTKTKTNGRKCGCAVRVKNPNAIRINCGRHK